MDLNKIDNQTDLVIAIIKKYGLILAISLVVGWAIYRFFA